MFPWSGGHSPFTYTSQSVLEEPFANDEKPSSGQEEHPSSYSRMSAPFFEDDELFLSHFLSQQKLFVSGTCQADTENSVVGSNKATDSKKGTSSNTAAKQIPSKRALPNKKGNGGAKQTVHRKRTGKKDRHSKICTAQGPRDRRMRLSLQIARKFFDLQDMLGFDKASKTIEWLFSKSKTAIKELTESISQVKQSCSDGAKSVSVTSDSEVVSEDVEIAADGDQMGFVANIGIFNRIAKEKPNRKLHTVARDSRDKARARARERTKEKLMIRGTEKSKRISEGASPNNLGELWSSVPLDTGIVTSLRSHEIKSSLKMVAEVEEPMDHLLENRVDYASISEKFLGIMGAPSSSLISNYSHTVAPSSGGNSEEDFPGFPVNWNNNTADTHSFCSTTTDMKPSRGNVQVKIPGAIPIGSSKSQELKSIFMSTYNAQEQMLNSIFMTTPNTKEKNPGSIFITSSNSQQQNPSSNFLSTSNNYLQSHFLENYFY